jgi:hypothetical protein
MSDFTLHVDEDAPTYWPIDGQITASDPDTEAKDNLAFSIISNHGYEPLFAISECDGKMSVAQGGDGIFNYEIKSEYKLTVQVMDDGGLENVHIDDPGRCYDRTTDKKGLCDTSTITVILRDRNEAPTFPTVALERNIYENRPYDDMVLGDPIIADLMEVDRAQLCQAPWKNCISCVDKALCPNGTVTNSKPWSPCATVQGEHCGVARHHRWEILSCTACTDDKCVGTTENCHIKGRELFAIDPRNGQLHTTKAASGNVAFQNQWQNKQKDVRSTPRIGGKLVGSKKLDREIYKLYEIIVRATDTGVIDERASKLSNVDQELATTTTVRVNVLDLNEPPVVVHTHVFSIKEHSNDGGARGGLHQVAGAVIAEDPDNYDNVQDINELGSDNEDRNGKYQTLTYTIVACLGTESNDNALKYFDINNATGVITVKPTSDVLIDYEKDHQFKLWVTVSDDYEDMTGEPEPLNTTVVVIINVEDVNERPTVLKRMGQRPGLFTDSSKYAADKFLEANRINTDASFPNKKGSMQEEGGKDEFPTVRYVYENSPIDSTIFAHRPTNAYAWEWKDNVQTFENGHPTSKLKERLGMQKIGDRPTNTLADLKNGKIEKDRQNTMPWTFGENDEERTRWHQDLGTQQINTWSINGPSTAFKFANGGDISGQLTVASLVLDYEAVRQYKLTLIVTDDGIPPLSRDVDVMINVLDVNEPPFTPDWTICLEENSVGVLDHYDDKLAVNEPFAPLYDNCDDEFCYLGGKDASVRKGWKHKQMSHDPLCISSGKLLVSTDPDLPTTTKYNGIQLPSSVVIDRSNKDYSPDILTYSIVTTAPRSDESSSQFTVNAADGRIRVPITCTECFDYERQRDYTIDLKTTDEGGLSWVAKVFVQIVDVNESPAVLLPEGQEYVDCGGTYAGAMQAVIFGENRGLIKGTCIGCNLIYTDPDVHDASTEFECTEIINEETGSIACADKADGETSGFTVKSDGSMCATRDINDAFVRTLKRRRRRLRESGRRLAADDTTVCVDSQVKDSGTEQLGDIATSNPTTTCVTILDVNYAPTMSNHTMYLNENTAPNMNADQWRCQGENDGWGSCGRRMDGRDVDLVTKPDGSEVDDILTYAFVKNSPNTQPAWATDVFEINSATGMITVKNNKWVDDSMKGMLVQKDASSKTVNHEFISRFTIDVSVKDDGGCFGRKARDPTVECNPKGRDDCCSASDPDPKCDTTARNKCDPNLSATSVVTSLVIDVNEPPRVNDGVYEESM